MEPFEPVVSSEQLLDSRGYQGVEELEKEAFNRGLPEKERAALAENQQALTQHEQMATDHLEPAAPLKSSPVILVIDDEKPFRAVITQVLSKAGYNVVEAANGVEGINRFYENPVDMIITDIIMPEKEGIETIIELKKAHPRLKLIAMSGGGWYGTDIDFDMAKKLGARTLDKPFALRELLDLIDELLN
jgi:CheY-like chemotaxis protein